MDLDAPQRFGEVDAADALGDVEAAATQWRRARMASDVRLDLTGVRHVIVSGMGGSGLVGDILAAVADLTGFGLPVLVHKGYDLPSYAGPDTLVIAVSYSGATEETCSGVEHALARGCRVFAVASGGLLADVCDARGIGWVSVPGGGMPRHSTGSLVVPALVALGLDEGLDEAVGVLEQLQAAVGRDVPLVHNRAKRLAARLARSGVPLVWGGQGLGALAAYRLKCQLNENAKQPALYAELPEANHNEVVAWQEPSVLTGAAGLVFVRDPAGEHPRLAERFDATAALLDDRLAWCETVTAQGQRPLARLSSLLATVDYVSVYAALALGRDPTPIPFIDRLKQQLASTA